MSPTLNATIKYSVHNEPYILVERRNTKTYSTRTTLFREELTLLGSVWDMVLGNYRKRTSGAFTLAVHSGKKLVVSEFNGIMYLGVATFDRTS